MPLGRWSISVALTLKSIYCAYFYAIIIYGIIFWGYSSNSGNIFMLQKKIIRIMADAQSRIPCRSLYLNSFSFCLFHANTQFHSWTSLSIIRKFSKQIHLYTILMHGISTIFIDWMPTYLVFKKVHFMLASTFSTFSTFYNPVWQSWRMTWKNLKQ